MSTNITNPNSSDPDFKKQFNDYLEKTMTAAIDIFEWRWRLKILHNKQMVEIPNPVCYVQVDETQKGRFLVKDTIAHTSIIFDPNQVKKDEMKAFESIQKAELLNIINKFNTEKNFFLLSIAQILEDPNKKDTIQFQKVEAALQYIKDNNTIEDQTKKIWAKMINGLNTLQQLNPTSDPKQIANARNLVMSTTEPVSKYVKSIEPAATQAVTSSNERLIQWAQLKNKTPQHGITKKLDKVLPTIQEDEDGKFRGNNNKPGK